jgi:diphthine synthase
MVLYIIGLGLGNEKDITLKGLEAIKSCQKLYLEYYTSILGNVMTMYQHYYHHQL